jgi:hypothetical protein
MLNRSPKVEREKLETDLLFEIEAPTEWIKGGDEMVISGWCFSRTGRELAGIRAIVGTKSRIGRYGIERPEVFSSYREMPLARNCGFEVTIQVPPGKGTLRLESIVLGDEWRTFFQHELTREPLS